MLRGFVVAGVLLCAAALVGSEPDRPDPARGLQLLLHKAYLPHAFDQEDFDRVWMVWPEPLRRRAEKATTAERRKMAFERYGLDVRPGDPKRRPMQYVVDDRGRWIMNCLACHGGQVAGRVVPGLPNSNLALQTMTEEIRLTKLRTRKKLADMDLGSLVMPLGETNGTTNAVMFGVALMHGRGDNLEPTIRPQRLTFDHHDMDAPPWWHYRKKGRLYADAFAEKSHRALMQFMLVPENSAKQVKAWEDDFRHIAAYLDSLEAPKWPYDIDKELAKQGEIVFNKTCARCHGTYGATERYPGKVIPIEELGTDPVRLRALKPWQRYEYGKSWFTNFGKNKVVVEPEGYLAPPLDGVWASAPYFHNGSVPTLWHVLYPSKRPKVWRRTAKGYDEIRGGLEVGEYDRAPEGLTKSQRREYFDTRKRGKSASGHDYPDSLTDEQKLALLEYLKTL